MRTIEEWVAKFDEKDMPVFKETVHSVSRLVARDGTSASELAQTIISDVSLTARILKLANSTFYNPARASINTVSRAVLLMGFEVVRDICLSLMIIDAFIGSSKHKALIETMAKSFHAAVQARAIAQIKGQAPLEEIFIAALLRNLGEMAFWCVSGEEGKELTRLMEEDGLSAKKAQETLLGFPLSALTAKLVQGWHLSGLVTESLREGGSSDPRMATIELGQEVAEAAFHEGWNSEAAEAVTRKLVGYLDTPTKAVQTMLFQNAKLAMETASRYGATAAARLLAAEEPAEGDQAQEGDVNLAHPEPDPMLQLKILREMSAMLDAQADINLLLAIVLEGMHRGVGMDRALIAMLNGKRNQIRAKYVVGSKADLLLHKFIFPIESGCGNPFEIALRDGRSLWVKNTSGVEFGAESLTRIRETLHVRSFFLMPIMYDGHAIGLFYADRQPSNRRLLEADFEAFAHLGQQANLAMHYVTSLQKKSSPAKPTGAFRT